MNQEETEKRESGNTLCDGAEHEAKGQSSRNAKRKEEGERGAGFEINR